MGDGSLDRHLVERAEEQAGRILDRARREAEGLTAGAAREAEAISAAAERGLSREAGRRKALVLGAARLSAGRIVAEARSEAARAILARLGERLLRLPGEEGYGAVAEALCREILPEIPPGDAVVRGDPACLAALARLAPGAPFRPVPSPPEEGGGVEAVSADGAVRIRNTLDGRFRAALPALLEEIGRALEEPDG